MSEIATITPEQAAESAKQLANRDSVFVPPQGLATLGDYIYIESEPIIYDMRLKPDNPILEGIKILVFDVKHVLRQAFASSHLADTHKEAGFAFVIHPCNANGEPNIDLTTNRATTAVGIVVKARFYAVKK